MRGTDMNSSCCQMRSENVAAVPEILFSPEHGQKPAFAPDQASFELPTVLGFVSRFAREAPPPDTSPGAISILRI